MKDAIVVGWTDSEEGHAALDWAVHQALLTSRSVVLAHDIFDGQLPGPTVDSPDSRLMSAARKRVEAIRRTITGEFPDLEFRTEVQWEDPVVGLLRWSQSADILAVGAPPNRHPRMLGALTDHLAAAADSPVALVPKQWRRNVVGDRSVVVGATTTVAGRAALSFAAEEAIRMSATLVAVIGADCRSDQGRDTRHQVDTLAIEHPGLSVEIHWEDGNPADALVDISRKAQLIVLGVHHSSDRWSIRLGPVTEMVLGRTLCPVITVARLHAGAKSSLGTSG